MEPVYPRSYFLLVTSSLVPAINGPLASVKSNIPIYTGEGAAPYTVTWIATPGVLILIAAFIGGLIQKCPVKEIFKVLGATVKQMSKQLLRLWQCSAQQKSWATAA